ncbi:MAG: hypothetical protein HY902_00650 [Deltaproteobacteria bacterium]|nr:hypothetical protein [Deltaproteobacteria bacterium]
MNLTQGCFVSPLELLALPYEISGGHLLAISVTVAENPSLRRWLAEWAEPRGIQVEDG